MPRAEGQQPMGRPPIKVKAKPRPRAVGPPPEPVPIQHSATFKLAQLKDKGDVAPAQPRKQQQELEEPFHGNAVEYLLRKADESMDEIEENPPPIARSLYEVSKSPVGQNTAKGVEIVAKVTYLAGKEAAKLALPVAGRLAGWAVQQGTKAAVGALQRTMQDGGSGGTTKARRESKTDT